MERSAARGANRRHAGVAAQGPASAQPLDISRRTLSPPHCGPPARCCLISIKSDTAPVDRIATEESVLLAVFADIHANRQAFSACLDLARARGAERTILLGDFVGYGADPEWTLETVMELVDGGALAVR